MGYIYSIINISGGLALFLFGTKESTRFFRQNLGGELRDEIGRLTRTKLGSFFFGVLLSAIAQSSAAAVSFVIGFVDVGLLSLSGSIVVMMGACLGGTFVSFLLSLNLFNYAPILFAAAFFLGNLKNRKIWLFAGILRCIALIFLGMLFLNFGTAPLFHDEAFRQMVLLWSSNPWIMGMAAFVGAGILQSRSAIIALGITLAASEALPAVSALPIAIGAHIGSTIMVILTGFGGHLSTKRLGFATSFYYIFGGFLFSLLAPLVHALMVKSGFSVANELVYGQILIALFNIIVFIPFTGKLSALSMHLINSEGEMGQPRYIDEELLTVPFIAVKLLSKEMARLSNYMEAYLQMLLEPQQRDKKLFDKLPASIYELSDACQEYSFKIHVPGENAILQRQFSSISHSMSILRGMAQSLCGGIKDNLTSESMHEMLRERLGPEVWERWAKLSRKMMRTSFRAFVIGEKGLISQTQKLESEFNYLSSQIRRDLGERFLFDRDISKTIGMISLMQSLLGMSKVLAEDEDLYRMHMGAPQEIDKDKE